MNLVRRNILANYLGNAWAAFINVVFVPFYVHFLGIEAYGLVGVYVSLRSLANLFDMGLSGTLFREMARMRMVEESPRNLRDLVRTLEIPYWIITAMIGATVVALAPWLASDWVRAEELDVATLQRVIAIMGIALAFQWPIGFYSAGVRGLQRQVVEQSLSSVMTTVRAIGTVLVLWLVSPTLEAFFVWQLVVDVVRTSGMAAMLWSSLPRASERPRFRLELLKPRWRFAAGMSLNTGVAIAISQADRIVLSRVLSLQMVGYYSIAALIASNLVRLVAPVTYAVSPRLTELASLARSADLARAYHRGTQLVAVSVAPLALALAFFPREFLGLWLGDSEIVARAAPVLGPLALAAALQVLVRMAFAAQFAVGWTRLALLANFGLLLVKVPLLVLLANRMGLVGAGLAVLIAAALQLTVVVALMHRSLMPGELRSWLRQDVGAPVLGALVAVLAMRALPQPQGNLGLAAFLALLLCSAAGLAAIATPATRAWLLEQRARLLT